MVKCAFAHLIADDRPKQDVAPPHEWTDDEFDKLIAAAEQLARNPESRYDYSPLIRITARLGLRLGEVLGLQWRDFDRDEDVLHVR